MVRPLIVLLALGCSKPAPDPPDPLASIEAPDGFEKRLLDDDRIAAAIPTGWKAGMSDNTFAPDVDPAGPEFGTRMTVSTNCAGACIPKDWPKAAAELELAHLRKLDVRRDEPLDSGHVLIAAEPSGAVHIAVARWNPNAKRYAVCRTRLAGTFAARVETFVTACLRARPLFF